MWNIFGPLASLKTGTYRKSNMSLSEAVTLDGDGGFGGPHNEEADVPSSDVELTLDLVPVRMVFTKAVRPSLLEIEILRLPLTPSGHLDLHCCDHPVKQPGSQTPWP
jgi:hypothetical protein